MSTGGRHGWAVMGTRTLAAEQMVSALRSLGHEPRWVASRSELHASDFARDTDIPCPTTNVTQAVSDPDVAFVYVAAALDRRAHYVRAAARAGKHILCDAPLARRARQAEDLVRECADAGVVLAMNQPCRASTLHQSMRRLIASGDVGAVRSLTIIRGGPHHATPVRWEEGDAGDPDIALERCVEDIDLARFLTAREPVEAFALSGAPPHERRDLSFLLRMDGFLLSASESFSSAEMDSLVVVAGSRGILVASGTLGARGAGTLLRRVEGRSELIPIRERDTCLVSVEHFVASVLNGAPPLASGADGVRSLRASEAVVRAARRGRGVAP